MSKLLSVEGVSIDIGQGSNKKRVVESLSFTLDKRQTLCIAGESGSGKSLSTLAIMGLLPKVATVPQGAIIFDNQDLISLNERKMQQIRGNDIAMIFQEPMTSLNPLMTAGNQLIEAIRAHQFISVTDAKRVAMTMLDAVKVPQAEKRFKQYPHEMSGGMRQRIMIAMALACQPKILIADEPTTALDVTIQAQILQLLRELQQDFDTGVLMITHDMGVVAEMADDVVVMNRGVVEEHALIEPLFTAPQSLYTQSLLAAVPKLGHAKPLEPVSASENLLQVKDLTVRFTMKKPWLSRDYQEVRAVEKVSFSIKPGETLGLVGESGCGKSTTGRALMNLQAFQGSAILDGVELNNLKGQQLKSMRKNIQMIFQDPYASLNSRKTIAALLSEPLLLHNIATEKNCKEHIIKLLNQVGLEADAMDRYPHQFSGGQRQRISIARAIASQPKLIIADESVSALDVSVQAQVLELLQQLQRDLGISYLFISHDMAVVEQICHRVAVMHGGQIVEMGPRDQIMQSPKHSYTQRLLSSVPIAEIRPKRDLKLVLSDHETTDPIKMSSHRAEPIMYDKHDNDHLVAINY
ncbi:ABC transporter ATP-binding protein [Vibrio sp. TH_r3]|uniref:ABC transporter ATP-binding protein n=1 Tax=Vibrio sp. TH_r3 TaxID=3082084 RepID=UPI0029557815|nr:ABC transporter ATP-binding protein [Vibrio sp. TH_r3]MDV7104628.1 ABC transporter ATP-binding protein [Vibrio sp. TH_r3]